MDVSGMLLADGLRVTRMFRSQDRVSLGSEHHGDKLANAGIIFDDENGLGALFECSLRFFRSERFGNSLRLWQIDVEGCADSQLAVHPDAAAALLHHAVDHGQAQSRSLPGSFGREEGLENAGLRRAVHACSGV